MPDSNCSFPFLKVSKNTNTNTSDSKRASHMAKRLNINKLTNSNKYGSRDLMLHARVIRQEKKTGC